MSDERMKNLLKVRVSLPAWALLMLLVVGTYYYIEAVFR